MAFEVLASSESWLPSQKVARLALPAGHFECRWSTPQDFSFATFRLVARSRTLTCAGEVVPLGSRAFDLLHSLIRSAGSVISKEELVREVWPTTTVEESNLRFQMASLRKALGVHRDLIKTIPGRGYLFTGECTDAKAAKPLSYAGDQAESSPAVTVGPPITAAQLRALIGLIEQQIEALQAKEAHLPVKQAKI